MTSKPFKPMLASPAPSLDEIKYPVCSSPKLDGIRCLIRDGVAVTRTMKPIPNDFIRETLSRLVGHLPLDGELMIPGADFSTIQGDVMRKSGEPNFEYHVFDIVTDFGFNSRVDILGTLLGYSGEARLPNRIKVVPSICCFNRIDVEDQEKVHLSLGYEGSMLRSFHGPYRQGRSTAKEGYLLKLKRFSDAEAIVVNKEEFMHNGNEATKDAFGYTERSSHKANLSAMGTLGALLMQMPCGTEFKIGTGFTREQRQLIWDDPDLIGKIVTYKYQELTPAGVPRFPVFKGFRNSEDMS